MTIKPIEELAERGIEIDLTGPKGNAFYLLSLAHRLAEDYNKDGEEIKKRMKSGDYEDLLKVFEEEFGEYVTIYR